jgi:hypothetical protein
LNQKMTMIEVRELEFKTEINVKGKAIQGQIKDDKLSLVLLAKVSGDGLQPPMRSVIVDKEWIDIAIEELKAVREKM